MELPLPLRQAVDSALAGVPMSDLTTSAKALSQRYLVDPGAALIEG